MMRPWQIGGIAAVVMAAGITAVGAVTGEYVTPYALLVGMLVVASMSVAFGRFWVGPQARSGALFDAVIVLVLGLAGCLFFAAAQPAYGSEHRYLAAMVWWLLYLLLAQVVSVCRDENA